MKSTTNTNTTQNQFESAIFSLVKAANCQQGAHIKATRVNAQAIRIAEGDTVVFVSVCGNVAFAEENGEFDAFQVNADWPAFAAKDILETFFALEFTRAFVSQLAF